MSDISIAALLDALRSRRAPAEPEGEEMDPRLGTMPGARALLSPSVPPSVAEQADRAAWIRSLQPKPVQVEVGRPTIISRTQVEDLPHDEAAEPPGLEPDADVDDLTEAQPMDYPEADVRSQHMQALRAQAEAEAAQRRAALHAVPRGWAQAMMAALRGEA